MSGSGEVAGVGGGKWPQSNREAQLDRGWWSVMQCWASAIGTYRLTGHLLNRIPRTHTLPRNHHSTEQGEQP